MVVDAVRRSLLKEKYQDEQVFVIPTVEVSNIPDLYTREISCEQSTFSYYNNKGKFVFRYDAEGNSSIQQIIPYVLIYNPDIDKYFVSIRTKQSGEARLYDKISLGCGGHINPCDIIGDSPHIILNGLNRELNEEIDLNNSKYELESIGTIRNITSELNDHLGMVFKLTIHNTDIKIKETDKLIGQWMSVKELIDNYTKLEDWAKFIVDYMYKNNNKL